MSYVALVKQYCKTIARVTVISYILSKNDQLLSERIPTNKNKHE